MELILTQLTDIHIKDEEDLNNLADRTEAIVGAISETVRKPEETMMLICVTGDIAYSGKLEQYEMAELFFDDIYEKIKARYEKIDIHYIFIPGNHDCDFDDEKMKARAAILSSKSIVIDDETTMELCTCIQNNYFDFVKKYEQKGLSECNRKNSIFTEIIIKNDILGENIIKLHCFNTAWCSKIIEEKNLLFDYPKNLTEKKDKEIVVSLLHHGSNWYDWEGTSNWNEYYKTYSDIIILGHDHFWDIVQTKNYNEQTNYFIKGNQLYSQDNPNKSGFNVLKINLSDEIEIFYSFEYNNGVYEKIIYTKPKKFIKNKYTNAKSYLNDNLKNYLEDLEIDINSKYKTNLKLSDIFTFPDLRGKKIDNCDKYCVYRNQEDVVNIINFSKKIIITGGKEYGKTTLLKVLFKYYYDNGLFPVFLNVKKITSADEYELDSLIRNSYNEQYVNANLDEIMHMEKSCRICFLDDFDTVKLSDKSQINFLNNLNSKFDIIIITSNNKNNMIETVTNLETKEFIKDNYYKFEIQILRRYRKSRIIDKWLLLEDRNQDVNSKEFDVKRKNKISQIDSVIKNGYFSNTPLELLLILSFIENSETMNADYSRYSYIYDCLIREKINEISNEDSKVALTYKTLLEILAFELYKNERGFIFEEEYLMISINNYNENYPPINKKSTKIIQKLIDSKIIVENNEDYKFKYNYMYYYFAGSYISNVLSPDERNSKINEILNDLSNETNYNIALFIAYNMNPEFEILPKIKNISINLLKEYSDFDFQDQRELLNKINVDVLKKIEKIYKIPQNKDIPELQKNKQIKYDEYEEEKINEEQNKDMQKSSEKIRNDFLKLLRLIEFQGDVLKNYATKIKNEPRMEFINLMGESNLKLLGFLCDLVSKEIDRVISVVEKRTNSNNEKKVEMQLLLNSVKDYLSIMWADFIEINVDFLADCWNCDLLYNDITLYKENMKSEFFDMVNVEYQIKIADNRLPVSDIEKCFNGKRKLSSLSQSIMKDIIAYYLTTYQYNTDDKKKVGIILGFKYDYVEEQRQKALGLIE